MKQTFIAVAAVGVAAAVVIKSYGNFSWSDRRPVSVPAKAKFYLAQENLPDSLALLPPPPKSGSAAMQSDEAARDRAIALVDTPRYALAKRDAARGFAETADAFSCALGTAISKEQTPNLFDLLVRVRIDARRASYLAKEHYKREQPYFVHHTKPCSATEEQLVRGEGSYPSARSAVGWAYALILADLRPARSTEIMKRGAEFLESRLICDVQWKSDVDAGREVGAATVAQLRKSAAFRQDFKAAEIELNSSGVSKLRPARDCNAESAALASATH